MQFQDESDMEVFTEWVRDDGVGNIGQQVIEDQNVKKCIWDGLLTDMTCDSVKAIALLALLLTMWKLRKDYRSDARLSKFLPSCNNLINFLFATQLRLMVPLMMQMGLGQHFNRVFETELSFCELFAFLETFLAVFEVECLTHVCIERYVVAKYITNGWKLEKKHYTYYFYLSLFFALLWSTPPLYGIGQYAYDFTCNSCTMDYVLPHSWQKYVIMMIFFMRSVKPFALMIPMLYWAGNMEFNMKLAMKKHVDTHFTEMVSVLTVCNQGCWMPLARIKAQLLLNQFFFNKLERPDSEGLMQATCLQELSPLLNASIIILFHLFRPRDKIRARK